MKAAQKQIAITTLDRMIRARSLRIRSRRNGSVGSREVDRNPEAEDGTNLLVVERDALRATLDLVKEHAAS